MKNAFQEAALERSRELYAEYRASLGLLGPTAFDLSQLSVQRYFQLAMTGDATAAPMESLTDDEYERAGVPRLLGPKSVRMPAGLLLAASGMRAVQPYQINVTGSGAELVATNVRPDLFIDSLRPFSDVLRLGAQSIDGMIGNVTLPRRTTASGSTWMTTSGTPVSSNAITESEGAFDSTPLTLAPMQVGTLVVASRLMMQQTQSRLTDQLFANDMLKSLGTALDTAAKAGSGASGQPLGIVNVSGVPTISGASFSQATAITAALDVANANAVVNPDTLGWSATPTVASLLMARMKVATNSYSPVWEGPLIRGRINGEPAFASNTTPASTAIYGEWGNLVVLGWGLNSPIEIEANPFYQFSSGGIAVRAVLTCNLACRHGSSFVVVNNIT